MSGSTAREELGKLRYYNDTTVREGMANSVEPAVFVEADGAFRHSDASS
jgi:hypothetical protein